MTVETSGNAGCVERPRFVLTVEALPDAAPAAVRLRRVIKALLRSYGFRLLSVADAPPGSDASGGTMRHGE